MSLERLRALLDEERGAAIGADLGALERLQGEKAALLDAVALDEPGASPDDIQRIVASAQSNVRLLRQLAELHRALVASEPTYTSHGSLSSAPVESLTPRVRRSL